MDAKQVKGIALEILTDAEKRRRDEVDRGAEISTPTDAAQAEAERLLPCLGCCELELDGQRYWQHAPGCPWGYRPAVAAALRQRDEDIELYKALYADATEVYAISVEKENKLITEIAECASEIERLKATMAADDERLKEAAIHVWGEHIWGCDTPDHMADTILFLRAAFAQAERELQAEKDSRCEILTTLDQAERERERWAAKALDVAGKNVDLRTEIIVLERDRASAEQRGFVKGLERAKDMAFDYENVTEGEWIEKYGDSELDTAIAAEIARKAGKEPQHD